MLTFAFQIWKAKPGAAATTPSNAFSPLTPPRRVAMAEGGSIDGVMHWVGKDVCDRLGFKNDSKAYAVHCRGVAQHHTLMTAGGPQPHRVLAEGDVHRLIVGSELPDAERFREATPGRSTTVGAAS